MTSQVWAPSISSQTRTQRRHRMQRLWSMANSRWLASMSTFGLIRGRSKWVTPSSSAMSCSSQWLFATQTAQTWLRSTKSISVIARRYSRRRSEWAVTSMPSAIFVMQAAASLGEPAISTMHRRQAPRSWIPSRWQRPGMSIPFSSATSMTVWPSEPATSLPSIREGVDGGHAITSAGCSIVQTPAGQTLSTMWARYSSRK